MSHLMNLWGRQSRARGVAGSLSLALLGLCMAGLALPASAQAPTAADVDRMLAEFDVQHQRTLALIEEAKAAVKPASAFAHLPPDAVPLEPYLGKLLVSVESGFAMRVNGSEQGALRVVFVNIDATPVGGFQLGAKQSMATATYTLYDIQQIAFGDCPANGEPRTANLNRDGSGVGFGWSCGGDRRGRGRQYHSYSLEPDGPGIKTTFVTTTDQGVSNSSEHVYLPMTEELLAAAAARLKQRHEEEQRRQAAIRMQQAEQEREKRRLSQERVRSFNRTMEGINGVLNDAVAEGGTYEEAQQRLDATVSDIQAQAAYERQAQASAQQQAPPRAVDYATQVAEHVTQSQSQSQDSETTAAEPAAPAAGKPLRFVMSISLRNQPGDKVNPTCYSNIISRPGPPGWGAPGFLPPGSGEQARETVYEFKSAFIALCRASGREITSDGNFNFQLNQGQGDEERLQQMQARYSEDVSVSL